MAVDGPALADRPAQPHRLPVARPHRRPRDPRLPAQGRRDQRHQGGPGHPRRDVLGARRRARPTTARPARRGRARRLAWEARLDAWTRRRGRVRRRPGRRPAWPGGRPTLPTFAAGDQIATRVASATCLNATGRRGARAAGRRRRPHRQHRHQARRASTDPGGRHPGGRQIHFGIREHAMGGDHERHGPARRHAARRRHLPRVQRLHARRGAPRRAVRGQGHLLLDPRLGRASARTARPTSRSSTWPRCGPSPACG